MPSTTKLGFDSTKKKIPRGLTSLEITDFHCHAIKKKIKELYEPAHSFGLSLLQEMRSLSLFLLHVGETARAKL